MGIIYSGQTITNTIIDGSTGAALIANVRNALVNVGWTVVKDGSADGSGLSRFRSVATPQGLQGDIWAQLIGNAATFNASSINATNYNTSGMASSNATLTTGTGYSFQMVANPFYFYLFRQTIPCPGSQSFMFHVPYIPPFLSGLVYESVIALYGVDPYEITKSSPMFTGGAAYSQLNGAGGGGASGLTQWYLYGLTSGSKPTWFDGSCEFYEPRVMSYQWSTTNNAKTGAVQAIGYLWDALVVNYPMTRGTTISYDGGSWYVLTESGDPGLMIKVL
jgi:hypothetical protein